MRPENLARQQLFASYLSVFDIIYTTLLTHLIAFFKFIPQWLPYLSPSFDLLTRISGPRTGIYSNPNPETHRILFDRFRRSDASVSPSGFPERRYGQVFLFSNSTHKTLLDLQGLKRYLSACLIVACLDHIVHKTRLVFQGVDELFAIVGHDRTRNAYRTDHRA